MTLFRKHWHRYCALCGRGMETVVIVTHSFSRWSGEELRKERVVRICPMVTRDLDRRHHDGFADYFLAGGK